MPETKITPRMSEEVNCCFRFRYPSLLPQLFDPFAMIVVTLLPTWGGSRMPGQTSLWDGNEWQEYVERLLMLRYGLHYQSVPATHKGDFGLEGFSRHDGHTFQCYAAKEPLSTNDRFERQRDKLTVDIGKFVSNEQNLAKLFGNTTISVWTFVVPLFDSAALVQHASKKAGEVRAKNLSYVAAAFQISVVTDEHFAAERQTLVSRGLSQVTIEPEALPATDIDEWKSRNDSLVRTLDLKLKKLPSASGDPQLNELRAQILKHYLTGENVLDRLRREYPFLYEAVIKCRRHREQFLITNRLMSSITLQDVIRDYILELGTKVQGIDPSTAELIGYSTAGDWLIRCPLDFP